MWSRARSLSLLLAGLALPCLVHGQSATSGQGSDRLIGTSRDEVRIDDPRHPNTVTVLAGQFIYDLGGDSGYPYASARVEHRLTRFFSVEGGLGFARINTNLVSLAPTVQSVDAHTSIGVADLALHAQLPIGRFAPYVGISGGGYHRLADKVYGGGVTGFSDGLLGGMKILLTRNVGLRGEFRWRSDDYHSYRANDFEQSLGLTYRF